MPDAELDLILLLAGVGPENTLLHSPLHRLAAALLADAWPGVPSEIQQALVRTSELEHSKVEAAAPRITAAEDFTDFLVAAVEAVSMHRMYVLPVAATGAALNPEADLHAQRAGLCLACIAIPLEEDLRKEAFPLGECMARTSLSMARDMARVLESRVFRDHADLVDDALIGHLDLEALVPRIQAVRREGTQRVRFSRDFHKMRVDQHEVRNSERQAAILRALHEDLEHHGNGLLKEDLVEAVKGRVGTLADEDRKSPVGRLFGQHPAWARGNRSILRRRREGRPSRYFLVLDDDAADQFVAAIGALAKAQTESKRASKKGTSEKKTPRRKPPKK